MKVYAATEEPLGRDVGNLMAEHLVKVLPPLWAAISSHLMSRSSSSCRSARLKQSNSDAAACSGVM
jgi:hypothetical protein